jgi:hypothetical protein
MPYIIEAPTSRSKAPFWRVASYDTVTHSVALWLVNPCA